MEFYIVNSKRNVEIRDSKEFLTSEGVDRFETKCQKWSINKENVNENCVKISAHKPKLYSLTTSITNSSFVVFVL